MGGRALGVCVAILLGGCATDGENGLPPGAWGTDGASGPGDGVADDDDDDDDDRPDVDDGGSDGDDDDDDDDDDAPPAGCPGGDAAWQSVLAQAEASLQADGAPGGAIAVVCNGALAHAAGIGTTRSSGGDPVTTQTRFQLASITKMFTGAAAVALEEDGAVDLHAPIGPVLGGGVGFGNLTLHQLLTHTAAYPTEFASLTSPDLVGLVQANGNQQMWAPPGAVWFYSNPGFAVAGAVLEQASGTPFNTLIEDRVFGPAGMDRATMHVSTVLAEGDYAYGHEGSPGSLSPVAPDESYYDTPSYGPMGGAWTSIEDMAHWGEIVIAGGADVMSEAGMASLGAFHTRTSDSEMGYGYGMFIESYYEPEVWLHGGGTVGFVGHWAVVRQLGFGVFVLVNSEFANPREIGDAALEQYVELGWKGAPGGDPNMSDFVGTYVDPFELGTITVTESGGGLSAQIMGQSYPMTHIWEDMFTVFHPVAGYEMEATFWRDGGSQAEYLVSIWGVAQRQ